MSEHDEIVRRWDAIKDRYDDAPKHEFVEVGELLIDALEEAGRSRDNFKKLLTLDNDPEIAMAHYGHYKVWVIREEQYEIDENIIKDTSQQLAEARAEIERLKDTASEAERKQAAQAIERLEGEVKRLDEIEDRLGEAALGLERELAEARAREERKDAALQLAFEEACPYCKEGIPTDKEWEHGNKDGIDRKGLMHPHRNLSGVLGGGYVKCRAWKAREALATPAPEPRLHINVVSMAESDKPLKVVLGKDSEGKE